MSLPAASQSEVRAAGRLLRRKDRDRAGLFLADGPQAVREALARPGVVTSLLVGPQAAGRHAELVDAARASGVHAALVDDRQLAALSETVTPQGLVAVCRRVDVDLGTALGRHPRLVVCCAQVRDPGNAGTIIRCADAFGADAVVVSTSSVDIYSPKTVRASVGSLFHLPVTVGVEVPAVVAAARRGGLQVLLADGNADLELPELSVEGGLAGPTLWMFGNEAWGLPPDHAGLADRRVRVPLHGAAESLNLSTAVAVCLYASATAQRWVR